MPAQLILITSWTGLIPIDDIIELRKRFIICNIMVNVLIISIIIFATSIPDIIMELEHQLIWKYPSLF